LRGEPAKGRELAQKALTISPLLGEQNSEVQTRVAILERRYEDAWAEAEKMPAGELKVEIESEIVRLLDSERHAKEHYNLALTAALSGQLPVASHHISRSLELAPHLDAPWRLAVKIALKRRLFAEAEQLLALAAVRFPDDPYIAGLTGK
jgi:tetratricopeptide (TPR) repeat protein